MKNELLKGVVFRSMDEVKAPVTVAADFYNNKRPHMSIDMMTPSGAAGYTGEIAKRWKSYRHDAIKSQPEGLDIAGNGLPLPDCQGFPFELLPPLTGIRRKE
jgi:hypothetical protein